MAKPKTWGILTCSGEILLQGPRTHQQDGWLQVRPGDLLVHKAAGYRTWRCVKSGRLVEERQQQKKARKSAQKDR